MQTDGSFFPELVILVKRNAALSDVQHFYIYAYIFLLMPFSVLALLSPALSEVVTQIRGHIAGSSLPPPTTARALHFYREKG